MNNSKKYNDKLNVIGLKIKYYREKNNWSLSKLSDKLMLLCGIDIPKSSLHRIEAGGRVIKDYELAAFSKVFKISPTTLLKDFLEELE
jgi:transcriptional regulator with XRE-family HTH domain